MRTRIWFAALVAVVAGIGCSLAGAAGAHTLKAPEATITGVTPTQAIAGQLVTINGTNLDGTQGVVFGSVPAQSVSTDPNGHWVKAVVPAGVPTGSVFVSLNIAGTPYKVGPVTIGQGSMTPQPNPQPTASSGGGASRNVVVPPTIRIFSPSAGRRGTTVRITGSNFGGTTWVKFGGLKAQFRLSSSTAILAVVPKFAHSGKITVHARGGTAVSALRFRVVGGSV